MKRSITSTKRDCSMEGKLKKVLTDNAIYLKAYLQTLTAQDLYFRDEMAIIRKRLLKNQEDTVAIVKSIIGQKRSDEFVKLLKDHIQAVITMISAVQKGEKESLDRALKTVSDNGQTMAEFFTSLNPKALPLSVAKEMVETWNKQTYKLAVLRESCKYTQQTEDVPNTKWMQTYQEEMDRFDEHVKHMLYMSDAICKALVG